MNVNKVLTKDYENKRLRTRRKNKPKTNPIKANTNPTCHGVASGEAGSNPTCSERARPACPELAEGSEAEGSNQFQTSPALAVKKMNQLSKKKPAIVQTNWL